MRVNKAIRWGNLPSGKFMYVLCTTVSVGKCFGFIHSHRADYSGVPALVCIRNSHLICASEYISTHISVLCHIMLVFEAFCLHWNLCNLYHSYSTLIAQTHQRGRGGCYVLNTRTNQQTPGFLLGYHYSSTSLYTSCLDQNKAGHFGWLNQAGSASQIHCGSDSLLALCKCERLSPDVQRSFFARCFLASSQWSAVLQDSCCDFGAQLDLKLLI